MKKISLALCATILCSSFTGHAKTPPLAFTCNAQVGDIQGQLQLFATGHTRYVFRKVGEKKLYACWLKAQYVNDLRQAKPGGLLASYHRSDSCKPEMSFALKEEVPELMELRVVQPLRAKTSATLSMVGVPGSYICKIKTDQIDKVKTFAIYGEKSNRELASEGNKGSLEGYPDTELTWDGN